MSGKKYKWHRVAGSKEELLLNNANGISELRVQEKNICITNYREGLFAFSAKCPHAGGYLSEGYVDVQGNIVCPLHRYKFNLANGRNVSGEGYYLKTYPVEIREDGIYIGIETGWFS
jgi:3-phenylpropionate/trans-cinnamate dioxygenase ferredoxin subunit